MLNSLYNWLVLLLLAKLDSEERYLPEEALMDFLSKDLVFDWVFWNCFQRAWYSLRAYTFVHCMWGVRQFKVNMYSQVAYYLFVCGVSLVGVIVL